MRSNDALVFAQLNRIQVPNDEQLLRFKNAAHNTSIPGFSELKFD
jgi:hypothetical protein